MIKIKRGIYKYSDNKLQNLNCTHVLLFFEYEHLSTMLYKIYINIYENNLCNLNEEDIFKNINIKLCKLRNLNFKNYTIDNLISDINKYCCKVKLVTKLENDKFSHDYYNIKCINMVKVK